MSAPTPLSLEQITALEERAAELKERGSKRLSDSEYERLNRDEGVFEVQLHGYAPALLAMARQWHELVGALERLVDTAYDERRYAFTVAKDNAADKARALLARVRGEVPRV